jgi:uncharacterized protein YndB with AHSA1/START domain
VIFPCHAERLIDGDVEAVFDAATDPAGLTRFFRGLPPVIPPIEEVTIEGGGPTRTGSLRSVRLGDGTQIMERVLELDRPHRHRYDMAEMNRTQRLLCSNMVADWKFSPEGNKTRVTWDYEIHGRLTMAAAAWLMSKLFQRAMQRCLDRIEV